MNKELLSEIKKVFTQEKCKDSECVSLYDVIKLVSKTMRIYEKNKQKFEKNISIKMNEYCCWEIIPYEADFYTFKNMMILKLTGRENRLTTFAKPEGVLSLRTSNIWDSKDLLTNCGEMISEYYDYCLDYIPIFTQNSNNVESYNNNFLITINNNRIFVTFHQNENKTKDFILTANIHENRYEYTKSFVETLKNNETDFFKRIFIRIKDCPNWTQIPLYEIRKNQLEKEVKKEKILEYKRKFSSLIKK